MCVLNVRTFINLFQIEIFTRRGESQSVEVFKRLIHFDAKRGCTLIETTKSVQYHHLGSICVSLMWYLLE